MTLTIKEDVTYLLKMADVLQNEATKSNIISVFDDGGYRELLLTKMFGLSKVAGRHGDDGVDLETGNQYELKTVNLIDTKGNLRIRPGITTCHHVNHEIINRYRAVEAFLVGIFFINEPVRIYEISPQKLEPYFKQWEDRLNNEPNLNHINNPKISFVDIMNQGTLLYQNKEYDAYFNTIKSNPRISASIKIELLEKLKLIKNKDLNATENTDILEQLSLLEDF